MKRFVTVRMLNLGRNLLLDLGRVYADFLNTPPQDRISISKANLGSKECSTLPG
jgi:hypothetical protein